MELCFGSATSEDCDINKVAGNTISVPVVGACAAVILGGTKMKADAAINRRNLKPVPPSSSSTLAAVWIGAQRVGSKSKWVPKFGLLAAAGKASKSKTKRCHDDDDDDDEEGDAGAVPAPRSLKTLKRPAAKPVQAKLKFSSGPG